MRSSKSSSGSAKSSFEQVGETLNKLDQITKSVADSTGLTQTQVATIAFGASAQLGFNNRVAGGKLSARADKSYLSGLSAQEQKVLGSMSSEQLAEFKQFGDRVSRDESFSSLISNDSKQARDMSSRLSSTTSRTERAEASLAERTAFAERVSNAYERGETISIDIAQDPHNLAMFTRYAEQYGGDSAAAHTLMEAELARQSLRPNRTFSDGTALPASFPDLDRQHSQERRDARLNPDINAHRQNNEQQVLRAPKGLPCIDPVNSCSGVNVEGNDDEHPDGRRHQALDSQAQDGPCPGHHPGQDHDLGGQPGLRSQPVRGGAVGR
jgi:conjugal transfer mating pair stabilization protein TraG